MAVVEFLSFHFTTVLIGGGASLFGLLLYVIYAFSIKEKSFEEVMEEQRKRTEQEELQQKQEKTKKEKEKKHKKWGGKKTKEKSEQVPEKAVEVNLKQLPEPISGIEIIEPKEVVVPKKKSKSSSNQKVGSTPPSVPLSTKTVAVQKAVPEIVHPPPNGEKKGKPENIVTKDKEKPKEDPKISETARGSEAEKPLPEVLVPNQAPAASVSSSTASKKKKKVEQSDKDVVGHVTVVKLISLIKESAFGDEESQMLIDVLLDKQKEAVGWKKVNDPQAGFKKQLQEKDMALEQEQRMNLATTAKLKQDIVQERSKATAVERKLQEKITHHVQEIQSLNQRLKQSQDQLIAEKTASQEKLQQAEKSAEEKQEAALKKLNEENAQLAKSVKRLESESLVTTLTTELETSKKSRDDLQKVHNLIVDQHTQLIGTHKREITNLNAKITEANKSHQDCGDKVAALTNEIDSLKNKCAELEMAKGQLDADATTKAEVDQLEAQLKDVNIHCGELEAEVKHLSEEMGQLTAENQKLLQKVEDLQAENEKLCSELAESNERVAGDGQEMLQHNGEVNGKAEEQKYIESHEKILQEKESVLKQMYDDMNTYKSEISALNKELEIQKQKNNELREKNWKVMDALTASEKAAEQKVTEAEKSAIDRIQQVQKESEEKVRYLQENSKASEELSDRLRHKEDTLNELREVLNTTTQECHELREKASRLSSEIKELNDSNVTAESIIKETYQKVEELKAQVLQTENSSRSCLQRIYPAVTIDSSLSHEDWMLQFEKEVSEHQSSLHSQKEVEELLARFSNLESERNSLSLKLSEYETVLAETEAMLNRLQGSAKDQEAVWVQKLHDKEEELASLQEQLKQLQSRVDEFNSERSNAEQKFDEVNKNYINLQDQINSKDKAINDLQKEIASVDHLKKELEDVKSKLEKEKKISKDFSAQMVRLNSLVKIGQDALVAEQENVKKLQSQLQEAKISTTTANGVSSPTISESESRAKQLKTEKSKKSKKSDASVKK